MTPKESLEEIKICLVGSKTPYPAFDSVSSILKEILGSGCVTELRIKDWMKATPSILKIFFYLLQDLVLLLKTLLQCKSDRMNVILIFQGHYPLTCIGLKLLNVKLLLYIGGSAFFWSHLENTSPIGRVFVYANRLIENICYGFADMIIRFQEAW